MAVLRHVTGYVLATLASITALIAAGSPADAQLRYCAEHDYFVKKLEQQFDEQRSGLGITTDGKLLELFVGPRGNWTILVTLPGGATCIMTEGGGWQDSEPREEEPLA